MSKPFLGAVLIAIVSICCGAQSSPAGAPQPVPAKEQETKQPSSALHLTTVETITAPAEMARGFAEFACDSDGNIYVGSESAASPGVRKLNPKGQLVTVFEPGANPDVKLGLADRFFLTPDGELYMLAFPKSEVTRYVLIFKPDGTYKGKVKLERELGFWIPASVGVFANGTLLVTGQVYVRDQPMRPFTGIFSADGSLLKEIDLEDDTKVDEMARSHDSRVTSSMNPTSNRAVSWGQMEAAKDGNIYVTRWLSPAIIYVVSPGGEVVRRFTVDPGREDLMPLKMRIASDRIALLFTQLQTHEKIMKVVDLAGHEVATYDELREQGKPKLGTLGSAFACYTLKPERFTFLVTSDDYKIHLKQVEGR